MWNYNHLLWNNFYSLFHTKPFFVFVQWLGDIDMLPWVIVTNKKLLTKSTSEVWFCFFHHQLNLKPVTRYYFCAIKSINISLDSRLYRNLQLFALCGWREKKVTHFKIPYTRSIYILMYSTWCEHQYHCAFPKSAIFHLIIFNYS